MKSALQILGTMAGSMIIYSTDIRLYTLLGIVIVGASNYFAGRIDS